LHSVAGRRHVFNVVSPLLFLGGLCLALNTYAVARLNVRSEEGSLVSAIRIRLRLSNIAIAVVSFLLLTMLMGYVFLENVTHR
jgi:hypothetical protein